MIYDYRKYRSINAPHNPQWSFVKDKTCAIYNYNLIHHSNEAVKCTTQCNECRTICEFNDYIRGMSSAHYSVPAIPLAVCIADNVVLIAECVWFEDQLEFEVIEEFNSCHVLA